MVTLAVPGRDRLADALRLAGHVPARLATAAGTFAAALLPPDPDDDGAWAASDRTLQVVPHLAVAVLAALLLGEKSGSR